MQRPKGWLIPGGPDGADAAGFRVRSQYRFHLGAGIGDTAIGHVRGNAVDDFDVGIVGEDRIRDDAALLDWRERIEHEHDHAPGTAFGEVVSGLEVVDKIVNLPRDGQDNPLEDQKAVMLSVTIDEVE